MNTKVDALDPEFSTACLLALSLYTTTLDAGVNCVHVFLQDARYLFFTAYVASMP
jgi:hypothetical protein